MAKLQFFQGLPDHDWREAAAKVLNDGNFTSTGNNKTSVTLKSGDITLKFAGTDLDVSGPRTIANGAITSVTLTIGGVKVAVMNEITTAFGGTDLNAALLAGPYDAWSVPNFFGREKMNIIGSGEMEFIHGSSLGDSIRGGDDRDYILTGDGNDTIDAADDKMWWGDYIQPGLGTNKINGTTVVDNNGWVDGHDLSFTDLTIDITANLATGLATGTGMKTTFTHVHWLITGAGDDKLTGGRSQPNEEGFTGMSGDDTIDGKGGFDVIAYDEETNYGSLSKSGVWTLGTKGVVVDLANQTATDSYGDIDTLIDMEEVRGTKFKDSITGDFDANSLRGFNAADTLKGAGGKDTLEGGTGKDSLSGGSSADEFRFDTKPSSTSNFDTITDFSSGTDKISLVADIFQGIGSSLTSSEFHSRDSGHAFDSTDNIVYDESDGSLWWDRDGSGEDYSAVKFAVLKNQPSITVNDFFMTFPETDIA